ncbi:MAG: hypothetical protein ACYDB3_10645, partial [Acidimicrobiales bacterium]
ILDEQRREHRARLAAFQALAREFDSPGQPGVNEGSARFPAATLRFGIAYETAMVEWLDSVEAEIP